MVERSLSMREVRGSMPLSSIFPFFFFFSSYLLEIESINQNNTQYFVYFYFHILFKPKSRKNPKQKPQCRVWNKE